MTTKSVARHAWHAAHIGIGITIVIGLQQVGLADQAVGEPWTVTDSKGRVRIRTDEVGDAFRLLLQDAKGRPRLALTVTAAGAPSVQTLDEDGHVRAYTGQHNGGAWGVGVRTPGGFRASLSASAVEGVDQTGLVVRNDGEDPVAAILTSAKSDETMLLVSSPSSAGRKGAQLWSHGDSTHGFAVFEESGSLVAGTISDGDNALTWMGADFTAKKDGHGVMLGYDAKVGAQLLLRHPEGKGLVLRESPSGGAGIKVGLSGASAQLGVGAGGPSVRVKSSDGRAAELKPKK